MSNMKNIAVYEDQQDTIMNLYVNPQNVSWKVRSTSDELSNYDIVYYGGAINSEYANLYDVNQTGLIIKSATTRGNPRATAGLYIGQCANNSNKTGAKLLVVRKFVGCFNDRLDNFLHLLKLLLIS